MQIMSQINHYRSTAEVAAMAGVHRDTLLRWLRSGKIAEPHRDARGWRVFTEDEAEAIAKRISLTGAVPEGNQQDAAYVPALKRLGLIDWDFAGAKTSYLTHGLHPYPAKYIPQIPNALIQELSSVGETVADIFCGSGTTLVESLILKRNAVGVDANPLACLISEAKTTKLQDGDQENLSSLVTRAKELAESIASQGSETLFSGLPFRSSAPRPDDTAITDWFDPIVVEELAEVLSWCRALETASCQIVAKAAFSSIVVAMSKQDSDTRYVRRDKAIRPGETCSRFARSLEAAIKSLSEFADLVEPRCHCRVFHKSVLAAPDIGAVDLVVCSPPYPNAWSYHLYHRTRMIWLGMDQPRFKQEEIGSHRKYSRKAPTEDKIAIFRNEMKVIFSWLSSHLRFGRYACFVVGDSLVDGKVVSNADLIAEVGHTCGMMEVSRINRTIQVTKKSFNPTIGNIRQEQIVIFRNLKGGQR